MKEPYEVPTTDRLYLISLLVDLAFQSEETLDRYGEGIQQVIRNVTLYNGTLSPNEDLYSFLCLNFCSKHVLWTFIDDSHGPINEDPPELGIK